MAPDAKGIVALPEGASIALLLVHGFCASSDELSTLAEYLSERGFASFSVQLAGHGTTPEDLEATSWQDWYQSLQSGLEVVRSWKPRYLFVVGFSMGGLLSIMISSKETDIDGLILIAPALRIPGLLPKLVPLLKYLVKYRNIDIEAAQRVYDVKRTKYEREPVSAYHEFFKLQKEAKKHMKAVVTPTLILQGTEDKSIDPTSAQVALQAISSGIKELHLIEGAEHVISCHPTRKMAYPIILEFLEKIIGMA